MESLATILFLGNALGLGRARVASEVIFLALHYGNRCILTAFV